jgi:Rps23 Pro-64 3,4-dihydroxylase Tpa1-like proline 4-hydroxylase
MNINEIISSSVLEQLDTLSKEFQTATPFKHISISHFFTESFAKTLYQEHQKLLPNYYLEDSDLYQFKRTVDVKHLQSKKLLDIKQLLFSKEFQNIISALTGITSFSNTGDFHSLLLEQGHYLLCHDDQVQGRKLAFIINLSKDWKKEDGGSLDLFDVDQDGFPKTIVKSITPSFNQFNCFEVSSTSFHQISEVLSNKQRLSFSGWYYNEK